MALRINQSRSIRNLAENSAIVNLAAGQWTAVQLPTGTRVVEASSTNQVVVREAEDSMVPVDAIAGENEAALMPSSFLVKASTTHLHMYPVSGTGDAVYLNFYDG